MIGYKNLMKYAAIAALGTVALTGIARQAHGQAAAAAQPETHYKDQMEFDAYNAVTIDITKKDWAKTVTDLDAWKQKYPDSWYKDTRTRLYIQPYFEQKKFDKVLEVAGELMQQDLDTTFKDPKSGPGDVIGVLFMTSQSIQALMQASPGPTPQQLAIGEKAARKLVDYNRKPEGIADADWNTAKAQLQGVAKAALLGIALLPGTQAMAKNPKDCETGRSVFEKALGDYPDKTYISYNLGTAYACLGRVDPSKAGEMMPKAIFEFVRAAAADPTLGGSADAKKISDYAKTVYTGYHGSDEGLDQLMAQAKGAALPPAGFTIKTAAKQNIT